MTRRVDCTIDVGSFERVGGPFATAVTVHLPDVVPAAPVVVFAFPGGGYSRGYYDIQRPELPGPSQADYHCARGFIVVACDHLGVGDSSQPDPASLTIPDLADANHRTVEGVLELLAAGEIPDVDAIADPYVIGIGQSMGGCVGVVHQARHRDFEAFAVLGYAGARMQLPTPPDGQEMLRYAFHWDEEPSSVVDADLGGDPQPWRSATMPGCVPEMANSGLIATEARQIDVPLFIAAGERDVIEDLYAEPDAYRSSNDITLYRLARSAHMHNFAPTRAELWRRLHNWIEGLR